MGKFYWEWHPDGPFATLIRSRPLTCTPRHSRALKRTICTRLRRIPASASSDRNRRSALRETASRIMVLWSACFCCLAHGWRRSRFP